MNRKILICVVIWFCNQFTPSAYSQPTLLNSHTGLFQPISLNLIGEHIKTSPKVFLQAAQYVSNYYYKSTNEWEKKLLKSPVLEKNVISHQQTQDTLDFIIKTIQEDLKRHPNRFRILNSSFLKKHFSFVKWHSDQKEAKKHGRYLPKNKIRLTSYAVFRCKGSMQQKKEYPHALYEIISKRFEQKFRTQYSKQTILKGILNKKWFNGHVKPLVWLSHGDLEQALMQGSVLVTTPDGRERLFNVSQSNEFTYNKKIKSSKNQKKYWFFKEIKQSNNRREKRLQEFICLGGAAFAGDVENIGLGKIIALRYKNCLTGQREIKLGVLADRGSAFSNNLYQLDLFAGIFDNRKQFDRFIRRFPDTVEAYILKKK